MPESEPAAAPSLPPAPPVWTPPDDPEEKISMTQRFGSIPCFRSSMLTGISGGIVSGLVYFMFTSRVKKASDVMMGGFCTISLGSFWWCRRQFFAERESELKLHRAVNARILMEGTDIEKEFKEMEKEAAKHENSKTV